MTTPVPDDKAPAQNGGALTRALAEAVASYSTRRVPLAVLRAAHVHHDPSGASEAGSRVRLAEAIDSLVALGSITLPRSARLFERHQRPELPTWVERPALARPERAPAPSRVWRSELTEAAAISASPADFAILNAVDTFLRDGGAGRPVVPHRERSLEVFGHEKRLDTLLRTRLFATGALNLGLLRAYVAPLPLTAQHTGDPGPTPTLLIVENHSTYASALALARQRAATGPALAVGYGSGSQAPASISGALQLEPVPVDIVYFGDLDANGLAIPAAADLAARAAGLPAVRPALPLYAALLEHGTLDVAKGGPVSERDARALVAWLSDGQIAACAAQLLVAGRRLAQEAVGFERLADLPHWY
jgi:hypothetical protein